MSVIIVQNDSSDCFTRAYGSISPYKVSILEYTNELNEKLEDDKVKDQSRVIAIDYLLAIREITTHLIEQERQKLCNSIRDSAIIVVNNE